MVDLTMAYPAGIEPTTFGVGSQHSIRLSYGYISVEQLIHLIYVFYQHFFIFFIILLDLRFKYMY